jgi:hypothetical protein
MKPSRLLKNRLFVRLLKNAQIQGSRGAFHLPVRQAILCRERFQTVPYGVRRNKPAPCLTRGGMRAIPRSAGLMGVFQQPARRAGSSADQGHIPPGSRNKTGGGHSLMSLAAYPRIPEELFLKTLAVQNQTE